MATFTTTAQHRGIGSQRLERAIALARGAASDVRGTAANARRSLAWAPAFARDLTIVLGVIGVYFVLRGLAPTRLDESVALTNDLVAVEKATYTFWEPQIQDWSLQNHWVQELANFTYAYLHFPVLAMVAIWLWFRDRSRFVFLRNVMFTSMVIGLFVYYAFPAAPPRLMELHGYDMGFTDTVFGAETSVSYAQPSLITNEYAAIPSFHFGWIALASAAIWTTTRNPFARTVAVSLTVLMTWAIVASANHLFIDMALGGLVIVASWWVAGHLSVAKRFVARQARATRAHQPIELPASQWLAPNAAFAAREVCAA
ncbi:MAG: phosphatase PAP2 family protein [Dehalococcoidia bacterium]